MTLYYIKSKGDEMPKGINSPFNNLGLSVFVSEELASNYIDQMCGTSPTIKPHMFDIADFNIGEFEDNTIYQVMSWIHEDKKRGYYMLSVPYASIMDAQNDKIWIDAIQTIVFNSSVGYHRSEETNTILSGIGCNNPFKTTTDQIQYLNYYAYIGKVKVVKDVSEFIF